jgi:hypothetical protein
MIVPLPIFTSAVAFEKDHLRNSEKFNKPCICQECREGIVVFGRGLGGVGSGGHLHSPSFERRPQELDLLSALSVKEQRIHVCVRSESTDFFQRDISTAEFAHSE